VKPDLICLAKSIGGGLPLGRSVQPQSDGSDLAAQVFHGGTYNTNRVAMAAVSRRSRSSYTRELCSRR